MKTNDIIEAFEKFTATGDKSNGILIADDKGGDSYSIRTTNSAYHDLLSLLVNTIATFIKRADSKEVAVAVVADVFASVGLENNEEDIEMLQTALDAILLNKVSTESPTVQ